MALRGRAIPNRPVIGRAQLIPVAVPAIPLYAYFVKPVFTGRPRARFTASRNAVPMSFRKTCYQVRPVFTGRIPARAFFGRIQGAPAYATALARPTYVVKPVYTGRPLAKATFGRVYLPLAALDVIRPTQYLVRPVFTGRPRAKFTSVRRQSIAAVPRLSRSHYLIRPVFTGHTRWRTIYSHRPVRRIAATSGGGVYVIIRDVDDVLLYQSRTARSYREAVQEALDHNVSLAGVRFRGQYIPGLRAIGADLTAANMTDAIVTGSNFSQASMDSITATRTQAANCNFTVLDLTGANMASATLDGSTFVATTVTSVVVTDASVEGCEVDRLAQLAVGSAEGDQRMFFIYRDSDDVVLFATTKAKTFREAVQRALSAGVSLAGARLRGEDLRGLQAVSANFAGALMSAANISGGNFSGATLDDVDFTDGVAEFANFVGASLTNMDATGANLNGAKFIGTGMVGIVVDDASAEDVVVDEEAGEALDL